MLSAPSSCVNCHLCKIVFSYILPRGVRWRKRHLGGGSSVSLNKLVRLCPDLFADINLPLAFCALIIVVFCLNVRTPERSVYEKLAEVDWL